MKCKSRRDQKGAMLITVALWFITLIAFAAAVFDIGHLLVVRNELRNAADAAALAGANCLDKTTAPLGTDCTSTRSPTLNWAIAQTKAGNAIGLNMSDGTSLVTATVQTGYWNLNGGTALQPTTLSPIGPCNKDKVTGLYVGPCDKPAVMVTVQRAAGSNGGSVGTLIATMFGGAAVPVSGTAIAVISSPGYVPPGTVIPEVINKCMYDLFWDSTSGTPILAPDNNPINGVPQVQGQPIEVRIGSAYHYGPCDSGQWTSFLVNSNGASYTKSLIDTGNPDPLSIGDLTWIQTGSKTTDYTNLDAKYPTPPGADVTILVVDQPAGALQLNIQSPIYAFAGFHIDDIQNGSDKYIQGHFIQGLTTPSSGVGPSYGAYTPPRLAL
jgi:Flp pilus assembly protein TadG